jgi:hypothetical protein
MEEHLLPTSRMEKIYRELFSRWYPLTEWEFNCFREISGSNHCYYCDSKRGINMVVYYFGPSLVIHSHHNTGDFYANGTLHLE